MAECLLLKGGGGGTTSDELTATRANVEVGKTAVTKDSDDEAATGTLRNITNDTTIDHASNNSTPVVVGDQAYISTNTDGVTRAEIRFNGTRGVLEPNTLIGIPQGTMASAGGLIASKLMKNQSAFGISGTATSDATATAAYIRSGYTAYVNGSKITGSMSVSSLVSFSVATYSTTQVTATWRWPSKGPYSGVAICGKTGGYPANIGDSRLYTGSGSNYNLGATTSVIIGGLQPGQTYYFAAWVYCNTNNGDMYSACRQATAATKPQGQQTFTSSGTFTVPAGVTSIDVFCVGGGGAGHRGETGGSHHDGGRGGCSGCTSTRKGIAVSPGQQFPVTVGAGAYWSQYSSSSWILYSPGNSSFGSLVSAEAGDPSNSSYGNMNWFGGSGGGSEGSEGRAASAGASDGNDGAAQNFGQGSTTRAFGESGNTLYAGGGGGGGSKEYPSGAAGGSGGGGNGGGEGGDGANGTPGTGSAGGGGGGRTAGATLGGAGGSGCVIVRWGY